MIPALAAHLASGHTTIARAWALTRRDGLALGFTDHDRPLAFEGMTFRPDSGLSARALVAGTGLAVDNTEVLGALSDAAIREEDIAAGRYDGAEMRMWIVNWADPAQRHLRFRGHLGEIRRGEGAFHAELRGLTEPLNTPRGRVFHRDCAAVLGDADCRVDLSAEGFSAEATVLSAENGQVFRLAHDAHADRWFERGLLRADGQADGQLGLVKSDRLAADGIRTVTLWEPLGVPLGPGDPVRLVAGCDKRFATCRFKFDNALNFQGFPHLPGDDWLMAGPRRGGA